MFKFFKKNRNLYEPPGYKERPKPDEEKEWKKGDITFITYNKKEYKVKKNVDIDNLKSIEYEEKYNYWIHINSTSDITLINNLSQIFNLHDLVIEDIISNNQRSKIENWDQYLFMVMKFIQFSEKDSSFTNKELNMILKENVLISFQDEDIEFYNPILNRVSNEKGNIRKYDITYLFYALKDLLIDHSFLVLEKIDDILEHIEDIIVSDPEPEHLEGLYDTKKDLIMIRKSIWPLRDILNKILRGDYEIFDDNMMLYYRDLYDHVIQIIDIVESFRDVVSGQIDLYMSSVSNKMNQVMQFLTIVGTIFIPLTFIAGVYGMNFKFMPELDWKYSYPAVWAVMIGVTLIMIYIFKKKDWF